MTRITTFEQYHSDYQFALENPVSFWEKQAREFIWKKSWDTVLKGDFETNYIEWFSG